MFRKFGVSALAIALLAVAVPASASVFSQGLTFDGISDKLQDNSVSFALYDNGDGIVSQGDVIGGIIQWEKNVSTGADFADTTLAVFSATVISSGTASRQVNGMPGILFQLGPSPIGNPVGTGFSLSELLPNQSAAASGFAGNTVGAVFSNPGGLDLTTINFFSALTQLDNTAAWSLDASFGIVAGTNAQGGTDYFEANLGDNNGDNVITISQTLDPNGLYADEWYLFDGQIGEESGMFSVLINNLTNLPMLPVTVTDISGGTTVGDIALLRETQLTQVEPGQAANGYIFADNAWVRLNVPVPEPASVVVWMGLLCGAAVWFGRRRG